MPIALYHEWQSYPTILHFADQCALMRRLRQIPLAEIQQPALFAAVLAHIQISHQHNGLFEMGEADAPMRARGVPTATVSSSPTRICSSTPEAGAGTSVSTLSVETSRSGSSTWTASPTRLSHVVTVPLATDSPRAGILIGSDMIP